MTWSLRLLVLFQAACALAVLWDLAATVLGLRAAPISWQTREFIEIGAALGLLIGLGLGTWLLLKSRRRTADVEAQLRVASGAFAELLQERFTEWGLTPAERDVALFAIKGLTTSEIAAMRQTSEGTIKAQTNAIYRKAGVSGRSQLLSVFIEDLMGDALVPDGRQPVTSGASRA